MFLFSPNKEVFLVFLPTLSASRMFSFNSSSFLEQTSFTCAKSFAKTQSLLQMLLIDSCGLSSLRFFSGRQVVLFQDILRHQYVHWLHLVTSGCKLSWFCCIFPFRSIHCQKFLGILGKNFAYEMKRSLMIEESFSIFASVNLPLHLISNVSNALLRKKNENGEIAKGNYFLFCN